MLVFIPGAFINLFGTPFVFVPRAFTNPMWILEAWRLEKKHS